MGVVIGIWFRGFLRSPTWTALVWICKGLFPFPAHAGFGVFEDDALFEELLADLVGAREILRLFGGGALLDHRVDFGIADLVGLDGRGEHVEDRVELLEERQRVFDIARAKL